MNFYALSYSKKFHSSLLADVIFHIPVGIGVVLHSVFKMFLFFTALFPTGFFVRIELTLLI